MLQASQNVVSALAGTTFKGCGGEALSVNAMQLDSTKGSTMKPLSEQLTDLAARSKNTEDVIAAAQEKNRARLESQRDELKASIAAGNAQARQRAEADEAKTQQWWNDIRSSVDAQFTTMRAEADERRTERGIKKAERHAEQAEQDAADAIDWALYFLYQAEYSARNADDLALNA
jgi:hypothetical protein